jgi:hypothetical protein
VLAAPSGVVAPPVKNEKGFVVNPNAALTAVLKHTRRATRDPTLPS